MHFILLVDHKYVEFSDFFPNSLLLNASHFLNRGSLLFPPQDASFLLTHRPQSDKLPWCIPVRAGEDPHSPDTPRWFAHL